jgi:hypothetical protein
VLSNSIVINISASDINLSNVTIYLFNSTGLVNSTTISSGQFIVNFTNIGAGDYWFNATAIDISGNSNSTETRSVYVDASHHQVTINSPINTTYTSNSILVNISITNEAGYCIYSLDGGATNYTLTTSNSMDFTGTRTLANGDYILYAYCNDTGGNRNDSMTVNFTINYQSGGGGGGGGGGEKCTETTWTCGDWGKCITNERTRTCTSNCDTTKTETDVCVVCVNECSEEKDYCEGNSVKHCGLEGECYKIAILETCTENETCSDGACIAVEKEEKKIEVENPQPVNEGGTIAESGGSVWNWTKPSGWVPHGNIPAPIVDATITTVAVGATVSIFWFIGLWIIGLFLPLFTIKLKHFIVYIFDAQNLLGMVKDKKVDRKKLVELLEDIAIKFESPAFADISEEIVRYITKSGFIEARLDEPFIVVGHFTNRKDADTFEKALREVVEKKIGKERGNKLRISRNVEKASIIRVVRAYFRKRKTEKELRRVFKK